MTPCRMVMSERSSARRWRMKLPFASGSSASAAFTPEGGRSLNFGDSSARERHEPVAQLAS